MRSSASGDGGWMPMAREWVVGASRRSRTRTDTPCWSRRAARYSPTGPPPTTTTSITVRVPVEGQEVAEGRAGQYRPARGSGGPQFRSCVAPGDRSQSVLPDERTGERPRNRVEQGVSSGAAADVVVDDRAAGQQRRFSQELRQVKQAPGGPGGIGNEPT